MCKFNNTKRIYEGEKIMTVFLIILIIFLIVQANSKITKSAQSKEYFRRNKSNAKLQYDTSCETIKQMGEAYREYLSTITLNDYLYNGENYEDAYNNLLNEKSPCLKDEHMWLISTIKTMQIQPDKNCMKKIYSERIWEFLPDTYSKDFLQSWTKRFNLANINKEILKKQINKIILIKQKILHNNKNGNSYVAYTNSKALDYVAKKFNLPTSAELMKLKEFPYGSLQDICFLYMCRHSKQEKYKHIPLSMICENPTEEQKQIQYSKLSESEMLSKEIREEAKIREKYNLD